MVLPKLLELTAVAAAAAQHSTLPRETFDNLYLQIGRLEEKILG